VADPRGLIEEPYPTSASLQSLMSLREEGVPLDIGEFDHDPRVLLTYTDAGVDIIRFGVTTVGGVESWLTIAADVGNQDRSVFPSFFPESHTRPVASVPEAVATEVVPDWTMGLSALGRWPARF